MFLKPLLLRQIVKDLPRSGKKCLEKALKKFREKHSREHPELSDEELGKRLAELRKRLELDNERSIALVTDSIAGERLDRAEAVFLIVTGIMLLFMFLTGGLGAPLTIVTPIVAGLVSSFASIATIRLSCRARQQGTMSLGIAGYEHELRQKAKEKTLDVTKPTSIPLYPEQSVSQLRADQIQSGQPSYQLQSSEVLSRYQPEGMGRIVAQA